MAPGSEPGRPGRQATPSGRRSGRFALLAGVMLSLGLAGMAAAWSHAPGIGPTVEIDIHHSQFTPTQVSIPVGVPVTIVVHNGDPIDHEWIVGDAEVHARHRTGTEPAHGARATELSIPAGATRTTTITFTNTGSELYICHLPGHEAYGMVGVLRIEGR